MNKNYLIIACLILSSCNGGSKQKGNRADTPITNSTEKTSTEAKDSFAGMVFFDGGKFEIGSEIGNPDELPIHKVSVEPFYLDVNPVTVLQFRKFISETGYVTEAEKFGDSGVFDFSTKQWNLLKGANWKFPLGPDKGEAQDDHPVVHVSWNDAKAFCAWSDKRLPTEAEWEIAARCGSFDPNQIFSWGNELVVDGKMKANVWEGENLDHEQTMDGYLLTSPVGIFGKTPCGLSDMGGNVWNWCEDVYKAYPGSNLSIQENTKVRTIRGGSFFFDENLGKSYSVSGRSKNSTDTSLYNTGFRCAKTAK